MINRDSTLFQLRAKPMHMTCIIFNRLLMQVKAGTASQGQMAKRIKGDALTALSVSPEIGRLEKDLPE